MRTLICNGHGRPSLSQISFTCALRKTQPCDASYYLSKNAQQMANDWFIIHQSLYENKKHQGGETNELQRPFFFYGTFNCNLLTTILTMPRPYSEDLQWCVIWLKEVLAYRVNEVAATLCVSQGTVERYVKFFFIFGEVTWEVVGRPNSMTMQSYVEFLIIEAVLQHPKKTLSKKAHDVHGQTGCQYTLASSFSYSKINHFSQKRFVFLFYHPLCCHVMQITEMW